ncbi:hypothetical protein BSQ39_02345 [Loigolactobacillus backii]|uniref:hypothetical protein n=1 Tax=Loigolactobacillus backii TaxID=375175 RepID=UPI000C1C92C1|nr:hypothetical protein [Loigolactobacillus backii]PIO82486.1 hypothetical protein BSQ39_02345 [Loigolactobacillus backii]
MRSFSYTGLVHFLTTNQQIGPIKVSMFESPNQMHTIYIKSVSELAKFNHSAVYNFDDGVNNCITHYNDKKNT